MKRLEPEQTDLRRGTALGLRQKPHEMLGYLNMSTFLSLLKERQV